MASSTGSPVRLGVVGCARILPAHLRGIANLQAAGLDPIRITALCARNFDDAEMFRQRGSGPPPRQPASSNEQDPLGAPHRYVSDLHPDVLPEVYTDWRAMLDADVVDAVLILAPVNLHHQIALASLRAGKHVLVEKPLAISVRAGQAIVSEAADRGLVAGVAENHQYAQRTRALRWVLDEGLIGTPQVWLSGGVGGEWAPDRIVAHTAWRHRKLEAGGGPAIDHGVHLMNQIRHLMGPIEEVCAITKTLEPVRVEADSAGRVEVVNELEDVYLAQLRFANGAIGNAFSGWAGRGKPGGLDANPIIYGSAGCIKGDMVFDDRDERGRATDLLSQHAPDSLRDRLFPAGIVDSFALELLDFTRAIGTGSPMEASAHEGVLDLAAAFAILESSTAGSAVRVADVLDGSVSRYQADINEHYAL